MAKKFKMKFFGSCKDSNGRRHAFSKDDVLEVADDVTFDVAYAEEVKDGPEAVEKKTKAKAGAGKKESETATAEPEAEKR